MFRTLPVSNRYYSSYLSMDIDLAEAMAKLETLHLLRNAINEERLIVARRRNDPPEAP